LEERLLLSNMTRFARGRDIDGDLWTLRMIGPGEFKVINQPNAASGTDPAPLGQLASIDQIILGGAAPGDTRLIGKVRKAPTGDGRVFFASLKELGGTVTTSQSPFSFGGYSAQDPTFLGPLAIDMPDFWLGQTSTSATAADPSIQIPDGLVTLRFGGADVTYTPPGGTPLANNNKADTFTINLGIPKTRGTSIIARHFVSNAHRGTTGTQVFQDSITISVAGRINLFQADSIQGNGNFPTTGFVGDGGTIVISRQDAATTVTGQIGNVRIGNDATNFGVQTNDKISNFYIGGETSNVLVLAPEIIRNSFFGRGMDTVTMYTGHIETLQANRGALSSEVTTKRGIRRTTFGGDVVDTTIGSGYRMDLQQAFQTQSAPDPIQAQEGGRMDYVLVAGDVKDSVFAVGVEPFEGDYASPYALTIRGGYIHAKVEGTIDNAMIQPDAPGVAFFAATTNVISGPVNPPSVVEPPFPYPGASPRGPRVVKHLQRTRPRTPRPIHVRTMPAASSTRLAAPGWVNPGETTGAADSTEQA
jgi:hypothetical protein